MASLSGIQFGSGVIFATPVAGELPVDPTPQEVGIIQDVSMTFSGDIKELFGQKQWAVDSAVGKRSIKGTFNFAQITNNFLNQLFFADTVVNGIIETAYREAHNIPAATAFTVTVDEATDYVQDLGVTDLTTGFALTDIGTGTPATGQYTVNTATGVYTFAAADASKPIAISYSYTAITTGTTLVAGNHPMGYGPIIAMTVPFLYQGNKMAFNFPNVRLGKIDIKTKLDDYTMMSTDFSCFAGAGDNPFNAYNVD